MHKQQSIFTLMQEIGIFDPLFAAKTAGYFSLSSLFYGIPLGLIVMAVNWSKYSEIIWVSLFMPIAVIAGFSFLYGLYFHFRNGWLIAKEEFDARTRKPDA